MGYWANGLPYLGARPLLESADQVAAGANNPAQPGVFCYASGAGTYNPDDIEIIAGATSALSSYFDGGATLQKEQAKLAAKEGAFEGPL